MVWKTVSALAVTGLLTLAGGTDAFAQKANPCAAKNPCAVKK